MECRIVETPENARRRKMAEQKEREARAEEKRMWDVYANGVDMNQFGEGFAEELLAELDMLDAQDA